MGILEILPPGHRLGEYRGPKPVYSLVWGELCGLVGEFKQEHPRRTLWDMLRKRNTIQTRDITVMASAGWTVVEKKSGSICAGSADMSAQEISLFSRGSAYERRVTLCHEVAHVWFDLFREPLFDHPRSDINGNPLPKDAPQAEHVRYHAAMVDWTARQMASNQLMVNHITETFGLSRNTATPSNDEMSKHPPYCLTNLEQQADVPLDLESISIGAT